MAGRRANGEGSLVKRADGRWCGAYTDKNSKKRKYVYGKTQREVRDKIKEKMNEGLDKQETKELEVANGNKIWVFGELIEYYLYNYKKVELKPSSFGSYLDIYIKHIRDNEIGKMAVGAITTNDLQKFYNSKKDAGYNSKTIRHMAVVINGALEYAERMSIIKINPNRYTVLPKKKKYNAITLNKEEVKRIIEDGKEEAIYPLIVVCVTSGMRKGEVLALKWKNVLFAERKIRIETSLCRIVEEPDEDGKRYSRYEVLEPKTKSSIRTVPMMEITYKALLLQKERQNGDKEKYADIYDDEGFVFAREDGRHLNPRQMMEHYHNFLKKYEITNIRFHDLRHTAASLMIEAGISAKVVQELLGHSTISTTMDIYTHITDNAKENAIKQLESIYKVVEKDVGDE